MKVRATFFDKTRTVKATPFNMREDEIPDEIHWIEREEDWYGYLHPKPGGKKIALVTRKDWLDSELDELMDAACRRHGL